MALRDLRGPGGPGGGVGRDLPRTGSGRPAAGVGGSDIGGLRHPGLRHPGHGRNLRAAPLLPAGPGPGRPRPPGRRHSGDGPAHRRGHDEGHRVPRRPGDGDRPFLRRALARRRAGDRRIGDAGNGQVLVGDRRDPEGRAHRTGAPRRGPRPAPRLVRGDAVGPDGHLAADVDGRDPGVARRHAVRFDADDPEPVPGAPVQVVALPRRVEVHRLGRSFVRLPPRRDQSATRDARRLSFRRLAHGRGLR